MDKARKRKRELEEKRNAGKMNQNNPLAFGIATVKDLVKLLLWVLIGANFVFTMGDYCLPQETLYDQSWPYRWKKSNFLFSWWGKTLITAWHSSRGVLNNILSFFDQNAKKDWHKKALTFTSPILVLLSFIAIPILGFFTTMYGAFRKGSEDCQQTAIGIVISIVYIFMGILFMTGMGVGMIQLAYFLILIAIIPLTKEKGLENLITTFSKSKGLISFIFGVLIIGNAFKYLNYKIGIGMIAAFAITLLSILFGGKSKSTSTK